MTLSPIPLVSKRRRILVRCQKCGKELPASYPGRLFCPRCKNTLSVRRYRAKKRLRRELARMGA